MKRVFLVSIAFLVLSLFNVNAVKTTNNAVAAVSKTAKVEVYYFHFTRRCATCQAIEAEAQKSITSLYPKQLKSGKITFKSVNLDEKDNKSLAEKCKAEGQALLVISGKKRFDLTEQGFMYAKSNPDKLKQEIKKSIDSVIK
jgi:hypothetical protein